MWRHFWSSGAELKYARNLLKRIKSTIHLIQNKRVEESGYYYYYGHLFSGLNVSVSLKQSCE